MRKSPLQIIHQDEHLVFVNKPAGILSIPDRFEPEKENLADLLREKLDSVFTVHRLDKDTSGIIVFARSKELHRSMNLLFEDRKVLKTYTALVSGTPSPTDGTINYALAKNPAKLGRTMVSAKGKEASTNYKVIESFRFASLVELMPRTGRMHQIRVHMAEIGHPLLVDPFYGTKESIFLSEIKGRKYKRSRDQEERPLLIRTSLHAKSLTFAHPVTGEETTVSCKPPKDFTATLNQLRKWTGQTRF